MLPRSVDTVLIMNIVTDDDQVVMRVVSTVPTPPQSVIRTLTSVAATLMMIVTLETIVTMITTSVRLSALMILSALDLMLSAMKTTTTVSTVVTVRPLDVAQVK